MSAARRGGFAPKVLNLTAAAAALVLAAVAARAVLGIPAGASLLDGVVAVATTLLAARWDAAERRSSLGVLAGAVSLVVVIALGVALLVRSPGLARELTEEVPDRPNVLPPHLTRRRG